jgi:restriction system protein
VARRKKTTVAEDLMSLVAMLPWWAGVGLAIIFYFVLHAVAQTPAATAIRPDQMGEVVVRSFYRQLAGLGQYVLPVLCVVGAATSAWRRHERKALAANVAGSPSADALDGMSWQQFERLVGEGFRLQGYSVAESGGGGADGGVDLVLRKGNEKFLVQCKQWRAFKVGVDIVRELYGVMAAKGAAGGFVVTSGRFTADATRFAEGRNVTLIDGPKLHAMIKAAQAVRSRTASRDAPTTNSAASGASAGEVSCPVCNKAMVKRTARRGANAGEAFWGCSAYPGCKGTRALADSGETHSAGSQ